jgi:hypothetical protein
VFTKSLYSNGRSADSSELIFALLVSQQRAANTRTSVVASVFSGFSASTASECGTYATIIYAGLKEIHCLIIDRSLTYFYLKQLRMTP